MGLRKIYKPRREQADGTLPISLGGTGARDVYHAAENLNLASLSQIGKPLGVIPLDGNNLIDINSLPAEAASGSLPALFGPTELPINGSAVYHITNYDRFLTYVITVTGGILTRDEDRLTFTADGSETTASITINDKIYTISVAPPTANRPSILSPVNGSIVSSSPIDVISSNFSSPLITDTHASSDWELATDANFTNVIQSSYGDLVNLISWPLMDNAVLTSYSTSDVSYGVTSHITSDAGSSYTSHMTTVNNYANTSYSTSSTTTLITSHETTGSISANTSNATSNETAAVTTYSTSNLTEYPQ